MIEKSNRTFFTIIALIGIWLIYKLSPILTPFLISALIAYLANPLVDQLSRLKLPRLASVIIVFISLLIIISACLLLLIPMIERQISYLVQSLPSLLAWLQDTLNYILIELDIPTINTSNIKETLTENLSSVNNIASWLSQKVFYSGLALIDFMVNLFLIPVVTFYLLRDWHKLLKAIKESLPLSIKTSVSKIALECDRVIAAFIRGQLMVMFCLGLIYAIGLSLIGLNLSLLIGLIAGLASIVPYLGFIVGIGIATITAYVQFHSLGALGLVALVFLIGQAIEGSVLTPVFVGNRVGMHPVLVIFAVLAGGTLFGFFGVLLAVPVAAVMMVMLRHLNTQYRSSDLYQASH